VPTDRSNFEGDWNEPCQYCGAKHLEHQQTHPLPEGGLYFHRMPCPQEQYAIKKRLVRQSIVLRTVLFLYELGKYLWSKVPFKKEARFIWKFLKHIYISLRALVVLRASKPK